MAEKYATRDDIMRRLDTTICLYKGNPYYVSGHHGSDGDMVDLLDMKYPHAIHKRVDHTEADFIDRSLPLGYMNHQNNAFYLSRIPIRRTVQPISEGGISCEPRVTGWYPSESLFNVLLNVYPSYRDALDLYRYGRVEGIAFHRDLAIRSAPGIRNAGLWYKNKCIAMRMNDHWNYLDGKDIQRLRKIVENMRVVTD